MIEAGGQKVETTPFENREATEWKGKRRDLPQPLLTAMERIRLRGYRRVLWQRHLWEQTAQVPAQGLAIPHEEIDIVCLDLDNPADESDFYQTHPEARAITERISAVEATLAGTDTGQLGALADLFNLSPAETDFLLLCAAPDFDPRLRRLYGYLHDDAAYCAPTPWLARTLFEWGPSEGPKAGSPMVQWLLAYPLPNEEQPWGSMARWAADPRIVGYLAGSQEIAPSLQSAARWLAASGEPAFVHPAAERLRHLFDGLTSDTESKVTYHHPLPPGEGRGEGTKRTRLSSDKSQPHNTTPRFAQLVGAAGIGRKTWAARLAGEQRLPLLCLDAPRILDVGDKSNPHTSAPSIRERIIRAEREAMLQGCGLYWDRADQIPESVWDELPFTAPVQLFGVEQPIRLPLRAPHCDIIAFALPTPQQARTLWQQILPGNPEDLGIRALAERFTLTPAEIAKLAPLGAQGSDALWDACRGLSHGRLGKLATLLPCPYGWEDIVLPKDTKDHLKEIAAQAANRTKVYDEWGFGKLRPLGRGISALFAGPSGTGKTMAAQVLAAEMGVNLLRIDLAGVVSKYIGETEKNLRQVFDEAERLNAVLFFDEADALFGKRTQVKDAHDRYANIEINYLLQRMESYEGLAVLATNRKGDLDSAFLRRLRVIVTFPMPGIKERAAIWQLALPELAPNGTQLLDEIDWKVLATRLEISGAGIKEISLSAAFHACAEETEIGMKQLRRAARRELAKYGRPMGADHFSG